MKMFESFNFDIIIVLILISSIISGLYFNLYRQGRRTLGLILPMVILFVLFNSIFETIKNIGFIDNALNKILDFLKITHKQTAYAVIIYFLSFTLLSIIIRAIYSCFRIPVQKRILNKATPTSRVLCALLGLLNGYVIGMILMFVLNPFIGLNYEKPITKIYTETANNVLTFSSLNGLKNVNVKKYEETEKILGELTGRNVLNEYNEIISTFETFINLEEEFTLTIIPSLSAASSTLINSSDILNSFIQNSKVIIAFEKSNPNHKRLKEIKKYLEKHIIDLSIYKEVSDFEFDTICNYIITNEVALLDKLPNDLYKDKLFNRIQIITNYYQNKDAYHELINYTAVAINDDVIYYEKMLATNTDEVISAYRQKYGFAITNLNILFASYLKNKEVITKLNPNLSLSAKLNIGVKYNYYFKGDSIFKNKLLKSYLIDTITNIDLPGYKLYSEYVFYAKLANGIDLEELSKDEFIVILNNLNKLVIDGIFTKEQAKVYFENLFLPYNNMFFALLSDELIEEIKTIDNEYLSEKIIILLS